MCTYVPIYINFIVCVKTAHAAVPLCAYRNIVNLNTYPQKYYRTLYTNNNNNIIPIGNFTAYITLYIIIIVILNVSFIDLLVI